MQQSRWRPPKPTGKEKLFYQASQSYLESLTLISHQDFLDCLGFDFGFVGCPEKVYETLSTLAGYETSQSLLKER